MSLTLLDFIFMKAYPSLYTTTIQYNTIQRNAIQYNTIQYKFYCQLPMGAFQRRKTKNRMDLNEAPEVYKIGRTCLYLSLY